VSAVSRAARAALAAAVVFAVSGALSGLLIDEYGGAAGAPECVLSDDPVRRRLDAGELDVLLADLVNGDLLI
jgi:hypothetical protein